MAKDYVQKYLWRDCGKPFRTAWQITLTADEAVAFMAMVCILITLTQSLTWTLVRKAVIRIVRPIQLPDDDGPGSLTRLTQYDAMFRLLSRTSPWLRRRTNPRPMADDMTIASPLFGFAAFGNVIFFIVMGVLVPWLLTGGLETPVVQSKVWQGCRKIRDPDDRRPEYFHTTYRDAVMVNVYVALERYRQCWQDSSETSAVVSCPRTDGPIMDHTPVRITHQPDGCPLSEKRCLKGLSQFQLDHENLTLRDYGLNIDSALHHSRRLTCTPLELQVFVVDLDNESNTWTTQRDKERENEPQNQDFRIYPKPSTTAIGSSSRYPNITLQFSQGPRLERERFWCESCEKLYTYFQHADGETFFIVFEKVYDVDEILPHGSGKAFAILFEDDWHETFTSHRYQMLRDSTSGGYAVAMCQEQHRLCLDSALLPGGRCTHFTNTSTALQEMDVLLRNSRDDLRKMTSLDRELCAFSQVFSKTTTQTLLREGREKSWTDFTWLPWTSEAVKWFGGAVILTRLNIHAMITGSSSQSTSHPPLLLLDSENEGVLGRREAAPSFPDEFIHMVCKSVLLLDNDYTNINFLGLMLTLAVILVIQVASCWQACKTATRRFMVNVVMRCQATFSWLRPSLAKMVLIGTVFLWSVARAIRVTLSRISQSRRGPEIPINDQGSRIDLTMLPP